MKLLNRYKFSDKHQSLGGTISTILGIISLVLIIYGISISFKANGNGGAQVGGLALCSFILAVCGCIIGLISFKEEEKFYLLSKVGSLMCGLIAVFMIAVLLMGL